LSKQYSLELLQALLASRLVSAFYYWTLTGEGVRTGGGFHTYPNTIRALPVFDVRKATPVQKLTLGKLDAEANKMIALSDELSKAKSPQKVRNLQRQIAMRDKAIDHLVYALYGLTQSQIGAIEAATP
jgi:hypothetical protein